MSSKQMTGNRIFLLCILVMLVAFSTQLPEIPIEGRNYPLVLIICSYGFCIYLLCKKQKEESAIDHSALLSCFLMALMMVVYIFLLGKIGYILATLVFLYVALWFLKTENKKLFVIYPIILTLSMYFLFNKVLSVLLPQGSWFTLNL